MQPTKVPIKKAAGGFSGDNMTEDEVAIMVKNALRKARRAMHSSSPLKDVHSSSSEEWPEPDFSAVGNKKKMDFVMDQPKEMRESTTGNDPVDEDDELAKRIEAEINSARAFAELAYFGKVDIEKKEEAPLSPACAASVKSDVTEVHANKTSAHKSPPSPLGYNTLSPRSRRKGARNKASYTSNQSVSSPRFENAETGALDQSDLMEISIPPMNAGANGSAGKLSPRSRRKSSQSTQPYTPGEVQGTEMDIVIPSVKTLEKDDNASAAFYTSPDAAERRRVKQEVDALINKKLTPKSSAAGNTPKSPKSPKESKSTSNVTNSNAKTSIKSNLTTQQPSSTRQVIFRHPYPLPPPPVAPRSEEIILSENTVPEKSFNTKILEPDAELEQLIQQTQDESNLVRRSNACGAVKVLASHHSNKAKLARTKGLLDALVYASLDDAVDSDALDARTRAVTALLYLSEPKDNRLIVAKHPGVLDVLVKVIEEDTGEARLRACSTLATLAKTAQNRSALCNQDNLATILSNLMSQNVTKQDKKEESTNPVPNSESQDDGTNQEGPTFSTTFSGSYSEGTETFTEDGTYGTSSYGLSQDERSMYSYDKSMSSEYGGGSVDNNDHESVGDDEEGVEMQISSLKKLNIENASDFLERSQLSACATLLHLTKHCANAPLLCNNEKVLHNIVFLAGTGHLLHTKCLEMLCNFTRFPPNNAKLASMPKVVETLTAGGKSNIAEDRLWSIRAIQNLCSDASSKVGLATGSLLSLLSSCAMRKDYEEQLAAVGALMNLATDPGSIVPLTNTKTIVATLVHLAHSPNTPASVRKIACDSLATIGLWLQTLASAGTVPEDIPFSPLPTHTATGWLRWD